METKFKIGDRVLVHIPTKESKVCAPWTTEMNEYNGRVITIADYLYTIHYITIADCLYTLHYTIYSAAENIGCWFDESWLTKVEEQPTEQVTEQVAQPINKTIDWEQRRWDLVRDIYNSGRVMPIPEVLKCADELIEAYMETLKVNTELTSG